MNHNMKTKCFDCNFNLLHEIKKQSFLFVRYKSTHKTIKKLNLKFVQVKTDA